MSTYSKTSGIEQTWLTNIVTTDGTKSAILMQFLCHMSRLTLRVEYTKLHYYRLRFVHVTVWKNFKPNVGLNFVLICIEVMEVRVRHGKFKITGF